MLLTRTFSAPTWRARSSRFWRSATLRRMTTNDRPTSDSMPVPGVSCLELLQGGDDRAELRPAADVLESLFAGGIERGPEHIQAGPPEAVDHRAVEQRAVGGDFGPQAQALDGPDHPEDVRVGGRFAESGEHDRFQMGKVLQLGDKPLEKRPGHVAHRLFPGVADAGPAGQVAAGCRFDIEPGQAVNVGPDLEAAVAFPDFQPGSGRGPELLDQVGRQVEASFGADL